MKFELSWALAVMLLHGNITERLGDSMSVCVCAAKEKLLSTGV